MNTNIKTYVNESLTVWCKKYDQFNITTFNDTSEDCAMDVFMAYEFGFSYFV